MSDTPALCVSAATPGRHRSPWRQLVPFGRRHRRFLVTGLASTVLFIATRLALPLPLQVIVDRSVALAGQTPTPPAFIPDWGDPIAWLAASFVGLVLLGGVAEHFQRLHFARFASRSINDVRSVAMFQLAEPGLRDRPGDLVSRVVSDSYRVKQGLKGAFNHLIRNGLLCVGICGMLIAIDLRLGLVEVTGVLAVVGIALLGKSRVAAVAVLHREDEGLLADAVHLGDTDPLEVNDIDARSSGADIETTLWEGRTTFIAHLVLAITAGVVLVIGLRDYDAGRGSSGTLFAVVAYLVMVEAPTVRLARQITRLAPVVASANRLAPLVAAKVVPDRG